MLIELCFKNLETSLELHFSHCIVGKISINHVRKQSYIFNPVTLMAVHEDFYTEFNGVETNYRIAHNLGILLMNSNCFAIFFSSIR